MAKYPSFSIDRIAAVLEETLDAYEHPGSWLHCLPSLLDGGGGARVARRIASLMRGGSAP
jgi:hypothetical protein